MATNTEAQATAMADKNSTDEEYGVLLYYKYTVIPDLDDLFNFYNTNCNSLSLLGRVRLSPNGVNVTVTLSLSLPPFLILFMYWSMSIILPSTSLLQ